MEPILTNKQIKELLLEYNIDDDNIKGTGKNGNVLKADRIKMYLKLQKSLKHKHDKAKDIKLPPEVISLITDQLSIPTTRAINKEYLSDKTPLYTNMLKNILLKNKYIVWNEYIYNALNDLYNNIYMLIDENYNDLPDWVNIKKFKKSMQDKFLNLFIQEFVNNLNINFVSGNPPNTPFEIFLNKHFIAYPLMSHNVDTDDFYEDDDQDYLSKIQNKIIITKNIINYIAPTIKTLYNKDYHLDEDYVIDTLYDLFFVKRDL